MSVGKSLKRIGILTGGGDCPGLNAVIRVVTRAAHKQLGVEVIGIEDGYLGLIRNRMRRLADDQAIRGGKPIHPYNL
jgi:6-phosphofructokinase 1